MSPAIHFCAALVLFSATLCGAEDASVAGKPNQIGSDLQLFVDDAIVESMDGAELELGVPHDEGIALRFDHPWEGAFCGYATVLKDGPKYRLYYRGLPVAGRDGSSTEVTCYAESDDGRQFKKPELGLFAIGGSKANNVILADMAPLSHNFSPLIDRRPGVPIDERYKALAGTAKSGLVAFVSADGLRWRKLREEPVIRKGAFDSQNVAFWSESENQYVSYFRVFKDGFRRISRTTSPDFLEWTAPVLMEYGDRGIEHLYTNQTSPYFRAPHIYVAIAARFFPGRRVLSDAQAKAINVHPKYFNDCSDAILMTTRGGNLYARTFMDGFLRPGIGLQNWVSRTNYPALNVVPTGEHEMSFYVNQDYGQPSAHARRYSLRVDGFVSVSASSAGGELTTRPFGFSGKELVLNFSTSAAGSIQVEIQDPAGKPLPGYALADATPTIGNEIDRVAYWQSSDVGSLVGRPIRLRFVLKDADLYSFRFR